LTELAVLLQIIVSTLKINYVVISAVLKLHYKLKYIRE